MSKSYSWAKWFWAWLFRYRMCLLKMIKSSIDSRLVKCWIGFRFVSLPINFKFFWMLCYPKLCSCFIIAQGSTLSLVGVVIAWSWHFTWDKLSILIEISFGGLCYFCTHNSEFIVLALYLFLWGHQLVYSDSWSCFFPLEFKFYLIYVCHFLALEVEFYTWFFWNWPSVNSFVML